MLARLLALALLGSTLVAQKPALPLDVVLDETESLAPVLPKVQWITGTGKLSDVLEGRTGPYVVAYDPTEPGQREHRFAAADLARALRAAGADGARDGELPPFTWLDPERIRVERQDAIYHWRVGDETAVRRLGLLAGANGKAFARDDAAGAFTLAADLWIVKADGTRRRITWDGKEGDVEYGTGAHRQEFGITTGLSWDPTGRRLAYFREDLRAVEPYPYVDYTETPPRLRHGRYPMAGRAHSRVSVGVYDRQDDSVRYLENDGSDQYWTNVTFAPDGEKVFVVLVNRGQDRAELVRFDATSGARAATLLVEQDPQWVEPEHGPVFLPGSEGEFLWFSSRDGWRHLYRCRSEGRVVAQVTQGCFDVIGCVAVAPDGRTVFVEATGEDPRQRHLFAAATDGSGMRPLTAGAGTFLATANGDASRFLVRHTTLTSPGNLHALGAGGELLGAIADATTRLDDFARPRQRFFTVPAADGTALHGVLTLPPDFDEHRRYPLLLYTYAGPHSQLVVDAWSAHGMRGLWLLWLASQGCVIATVDGRGTQNRGSEFEQAVHRRVGEVEVEDQLAAVRHLIAQPWIAPERIGVHGWSYGGYVTLSLMLRAPELFRCGIAGAPVTDWRMYETGYTERYLDTPAENPEGYTASSVLPRVGALQGRLLLVHGTDDRTVMLAHSVAFLAAAVQAGVLVDHMQYPMQQHRLTGNDAPHLYRLMARYLQDHLLAHEAPAPASTEGRSR